MKYRNNLVVIGIIIVILFIISFSYFFWKIDNSESLNNSCVSIIYSDSLDYNLNNPVSLSDSDGKSSLAKSISITNNCSDKKTIKILANIRNTSNISSSKIKAYINGDINLEPTLLSNLKNKKDIPDGYIESRVLYKYYMESNTSIRLNIRFWLDEYSSIKTSDKNIFDLSYLVDISDYVEQPTFIEKVLRNNNVINDTIDYSTTSSGLYNIGNVYYFRGNINNNYFKLDDYLFRIISINNNDFTIKLGLISSSVDTTYNEDNSAEDSSSFITSTAKEALDTFYNDNLSKYSDYFKESKYCSDTSYTKNWNEIRFNSKKRVFDEESPTTVCYSGDKSYGGEYSNIIGSISADEAMIIGFSSKYSSLDNYLYNGNTICTTSPYTYYYGSNVIVINEEGKIDYQKASNSCSVIPVVSIDGHLLIKGEGTFDNPYIIDTDE